MVAVAGGVGVNVAGNSDWSRTTVTMTPLNGVAVKVSGSGVLVLVGLKIASTLGVACTVTPA